VTATRLSKNWLSPRREIRFRLGKWYGERHGYFGNRGGWIGHSSPTAGPMVQGWLGFYHAHRRAIWAEIGADPLAERAS
jgi:hypothetical protein